MGLSRLAKFWWRTSFVLCAMATYKAATGFTALVIPLVRKKERMERKERTKRTRDLARGQKKNAREKEEKRMKATRKKENLKELKGSQTLSVCA